MSYPRPRTKVTAAVGRTNDGPPKPVVTLDNVQDWLTPGQARALAARLNAASDAAIAKFSAYRDKQAARRKRLPLTSAPERKKDGL